MSALTREEARAAFKRAGLNYDVLTKENVQRLRNLINAEMVSGDYFNKTFKCHNRGIVQQTKSGVYAYIKCKAFYFDAREVVSFNTDGFIGFAGWASDGNVQPILSGFMKWVRELSVTEVPDEAREGI